jgi:hypothetical protein
MNRWTVEVVDDESFVICVTSRNRACRSHVLVVQDIECRSADNSP